MRLIAESLSCRRGWRTLFEDLSFTLGPGDALFVTGANGAGKSSLLRVLAGLLPASRGGVVYEGLPPGSERRESLHHLGHRDGVKGALSVRESAATDRALLGGRGELEEALERVGLGDLAEAPASVLSAGQRRRLGLARLLTSPRPLWLLDEPAAALDQQGETLLVEFIAAHRAGGGLVVAAVHQALPMPEARRLRIGAP